MIKAYSQRLFWVKKLCELFVIKRSDLKDFVNKPDAKIYSTLWIHNSKGYFLPKKLGLKIKPDSDFIWRNNVRGFKAKIPS